MKTTKEDRKDWRVEFYNGDGGSTVCEFRNRTERYIKALLLSYSEAYLVPEGSYFVMEEIQ